MNSFRKALVAKSYCLATFGKECGLHLGLYRISMALSRFGPNANSVWLGALNIGSMLFNRSIDVRELARFKGLRETPKTCENATEIISVSSRDGRRCSRRELLTIDKSIPNKSIVNFRNGGFPITLCVVCFRAASFRMHMVRI